jgi:hypothetical protein
VPPSFTSFPSSIPQLWQIGLFDPNISSPFSSWPATLQHLGESDVATTAHTQAPWPTDLEEFLKAHPSPLRRGRQFGIVGPMQRVPEYSATCE